MVFSLSAPSLPKEASPLSIKILNNGFRDKYMDIWYMKVLVRLELIIVAPASYGQGDAPPNSEFFFSFFSCKGIQSLMCNLEGLTGTPRYLMGNSPA